MELCHLLDVPTHHCASVLFKVNTIIIIIKRQFVRHRNMA